MKTFEVNGKKYVARAFDFNLVCELEEAGVSLSDIAKKPMSTVRAYFSLCHGGGVENAGKEIEQHIIAGGNLDNVIVAMNEELEKSDFFRSLTKAEEA